MKTTIEIVKEINSGRVEDFWHYLKNNGYKLHHSASARGYLRVKNYTPAISYEGRFGKGIIIRVPNRRTSCKSNRYYEIYYFIKK